MHAAEGGYFDPETIAVLKAALDDAWAALSPHQQAQSSRSALAERICSMPRTINISAPIKPMTVRIFHFLHGRV